MKRVTKTIVSLLVICVLIVSGIATNVKADSNKIVEDTYNYFTNEEIKYIEQAATQLPEVYRFLILPKISSDVDIKQMAESLFEFRSFSQDTIFILLITDEKKIYITTGEALQKKELNEEFFNTEIYKYFVPIAKDKKSTAEGLVELSKGISKDIPLFLETTKGSVKLPQALDENKSIQEDNSSLSISLFLWVGLILVSLLLLWFLFKIYLNRK